MIDAAWPVGISLLIAGLVVAVASSVLRYRRARGVERQQLKWFAYAGLILALVMPLGAAFWYRSVLLQALVGVSFNAMPLAIGAAVLRYRLYDIDRIISRTLAWGLLTMVLGLGYAGGRRCVHHAPRHPSTMPRDIHRVSEGGLELMPPASGVVALSPKTALYLRFSDEGLDRTVSLDGISASLPLAIAFAVPVAATADQPPACAQAPPVA
ncbi:MAG: hypothetical protein M3454_17710 [Actinomycetota bacterium]|nr:hypothetical protein [Actinomycetota bacterium]